MKPIPTNPILPESLKEKLTDEQIVTLTQLLLNEKTKLIQVVAALIETLPQKHTNYNYNCFRVLIKISETHPDLMYPYWDQFIQLWKCDLPDHRVMGIHLFARTVKADIEQRIDSIFGDYLKVLDDSNLIPSRIFVLTLIYIVKVKSKFQGQILSALFDFDQTHHTAAHKALIWNDILEYFSQVYAELSEMNKDKIRLIVQKQLTSSSPKTRHTAKKIKKQLNI